MMSNAAGNRILGSLQSADGKGIVRMEDRFDTGFDDLRLALTDPRRLAAARFDELFSAYQQLAVNVG